MGLECDQANDFCILMGDLNYRMNTRFRDFNNSNVEAEALGMIATHDQLTQNMAQGRHYPDYIEPAIDFLPSYKLSKTDFEYLDKKD